MKHYPGLNQLGKNIISYSTVLIDRTKYKYMKLSLSDLMSTSIAFTIIVSSIYGRLQDSFHVRIGHIPICLYNNGPY